MEKSIRRLHGNFIVMASGHDSRSPVNSQSQEPTGRRVSGYRALRSHGCRHLGRYLYTSLSSYEVPGPILCNGAVSITQASSSTTASGTPTHRHRRCDIELSLCDRDFIQHHIDQSNVGDCHYHDQNQVAQLPTVQPSLLTDNRGINNWSGATACNAASRPLALR